MNTAALLNEVTRRGIKLKPDGDALCYTAPKDALTPDLLVELKTHKAELLAELSVSITLPDTPEDDILAEAQRIAGNEPNLSEDEYQALIRAIQTRRMRERGDVPPRYTSTTICRYCGPVPIFPGVGERVEGCPWCFNRVRGLSVPRPQKCVDTA